jgi:hypothetical protein
MRQSLDRESAKPTRETGFDIATTTLKPQP